MSAKDPILVVRDLKTYFFTDEGVIKAVDGVDFEVERGRTLCIVGESGCGKSVTARSIMRLIDPPGRIVSGHILFYRKTGGGGNNQEIVDLIRLNQQEIRSIRGREIGMVFQEPMSALSPFYTIGSQITEAMILHLKLTKGEARQHALDLLTRVGLPSPREIIDAYPFQLSGGMRQRAMIAIALACNPSLLIADEPTTALDVTTQAQILDLIRDLQQEKGMSIILITHDLGIVAEMADDVVVMYLGTVVERGSVYAIFSDPKHPYTRALLRSIPKVGPKVRQRLHPIKGNVPNPYNRPPGCPFHPRCDNFIPGQCDTLSPPLIPLSDGRQVRCVLYQGDHERA